jgi:hypothetical protein
MSSLDQIKAMLGGTTETQAKTAQKVDFEPIAAPPFYAPDPFDNADEYIAACRAHGMTVHRSVLECARDAEKAAQVAERRDVEVRHEVLRIA